MEGMQGAPAPPPMFRGPVLQPPAAQPQMTEAMMNQDLNMTRKATRPFVPVNDAAYFDLQRQVNLLETMPTQPVRAPRVNVDEILSTDQLPAPSKRAPKEEAPAAPKPAVKASVGIADQIAIRSYVLGKSIGKTAE